MKQSDNEKKINVINLASKYKALVGSLDNQASNTYKKLNELSEKIEEITLQIKSLVEEQKEFNAASKATKKVKRRFYLSILAITILVTVEFVISSREDITLLIDALLQVVGHLSLFKVL